MTPPEAPADAPGGPSPETTPILDSVGFDEVYRAWVKKIAGIVGADGAVAGGEPEQDRWALVGIHRRGAVLARRLHKELATADRPLLYGEVDISLYRDDYHLQRSQTTVHGTEISFAVDGVRILLVDDVLYTGRTVRAAMGLILDYGRPRVIQLAVFADRGHRELPIEANCVGRTVATQRDDRVLVRLKEMEGADRVDLVRGAKG